LPPEAIVSLADRLAGFWVRFRQCFWTETRDQSAYAYHYLSGLLRMKTQRNFAGIGRATEQSGENIQHFMSNSPWSAEAVYRQVQDEIAATPELRHGGMLLLDESADAKAGSKTAGAARQYNGRLGKVDLCQVGVFLSFVKGDVWTWVDGELFLPELWFAPEKEAERQVAQRPETQWQRIRVRPCERGMLVAEFAARRVWTLRDGKPTAEWLVIRRNADGDCRYAFSNTHAETPLEELAWLQTQRYFVERSIQDAKSEMGWDQLQAQKLRAWEHQLALTVLASWFVAQTKLEWEQQFPRDPELYRELSVDHLPALSVANVRELLRAAMPLPQLSHQEAAGLVVEHLVNRTRSRKSRVKKRKHRRPHRSRDPA
jgi:SRSO17 transposase